jgi:hypothetical protein
LRKERDDARQLEGLRPAELADLGLRRTGERGYRTFL